MYHFQIHEFYLTLNIFINITENCLFLFLSTAKCMDFRHLQNDSDKLGHFGKLTMTMKSTYVDFEYIDVKTILKTSKLNKYQSH